MRRLPFALGLAVLATAAVAAATRTVLRGKTRHTRRSTPATPPSYDEIALRAYFIGLDRETRGEPSAPLQDWKEAEHQLASENQSTLTESAGTLAH